jgi:hypothetical protein
LDKQKIDELQPWKKTSAKICSWLLNKHIFIHKIDKVYVDIKTKKLSVRFYDRHEKVFSRFDVTNLIRDSNLMDETDFGLVRNIINARYDARVEEKQD